MSHLKFIQKRLIKWYLENKRPLPWRESKNPYFIWISEVMLQQTTVQAVIPYFLKFRERFPTIESLAQSSIDDVLEMWAGLGYYSRARNLHRSAQAIVCLGSFPTQFIELLKLPGFGDYTARAVAALAFSEPVGVVDGNVIRVLSRLYGQGFQFWKRSDKDLLQSQSDKLCQGVDPSIINQSLMELGATICTPFSPACPLCPLLNLCVANKNSLVEALPLKKPKRTAELISLEMHLFIKNNKVALIENKTLPFLKKSLLPPFKFVKIKKKPKKYHFQHSIMHYKIYVSLNIKNKAVTPSSNQKLLPLYLKSQLSQTYQWHTIKDLKKVNPSSLLQKAMNLRTKTI